MHNTIVGVDLAKKVIQVCASKHNKVHSNTEVTPSEFVDFLVNAEPMTVVFEACATSNYWKQVATEHGHDARLISAKLVSQIRQNQKTDKNDALAVLQASQMADINFINGKDFQQQELQSIVRMRELAVKQKVALRNQISALLLEFNIRISPAGGGINGVVQSTLEDASNGFGPAFRDALNITWLSFRSTLERIAEYDHSLEKVVNDIGECKKLLALEGIGVINAANLFITLKSGERGVFKTGRDASACIGLTPTQHSSGGKTKLGSVSRNIKNSSTRSNLVSGAMSVLIQVNKRDPRTKKEHWLKELIGRRGKRCAAVALANKNIRTAFAILSKGTEYQAQPI